MITKIQKRADNKPLRGVAIALRTSLGHRRK
jgi:hypothetical protein